jgi:hypothetical protein
MKTFKQFITEMVPPPESWDRGVFHKSFKKQLDYAIERAAKIGTGSSRVVFEIEYEGRPTVLKIAKNAKGLAQNEKEADYGLYRMYPDIEMGGIVDFKSIGLIEFLKRKEKRYGKMNSFLMLLI